MKDPQLWSRIASFPLDDPSSGLCFSERLARENAWSPEFTATVLLEYRKFLYLCTTAGHAVSPSDAVDQAWHLHLCYTRNYWQDLCRNTLGFELHHGPTKGGRAERTKFADWYGRTFSSYREAFGENPPERVWPPSKIRFANSDFRRIDASSHFIVRKRHAAAIAAAAGLSIPLAGCANRIASTGGVPASAIFIFVFIFLIIAISFAKKGGKGGGGCSGGGSCGGGTDSGCSGGGGCGGGCGGGD